VILLQCDITSLCSCTPRIPMMRFPHTMHYALQHLVLRVYNIDIANLASDMSIYSIPQFPHIFPGNYHIERNYEKIEL